MAAVQCDNFVGNAWKKDLCLNCFKSKEEHLVRNGYSEVTPTRIPDPPKEGILKGTKRSSQPPKKNKVIFLNTECEVIGFGGDDVYSDDEDFPTANVLRNEEDEVDSEEDKAFQQLTKSNTDFNSISENLKEPKDGVVKKIIEPLKLGKQMFDDKGNKKTLLVSVTPFGDQTSVKNKINLNGFNTAGKDAKTNGHESTVESVKKELVVRGKIKTTEEKSEIKVNGKISEEICPNGKSVIIETVELDKQNKENAGNPNEETSVKQANDKSLKRSQPLDKNFKFRLSKDLQKEPEKTVNGKEDDVGENDKKNNIQKVNNFIENGKKKVNQFPIITENQNNKFGAKDLSNCKSKKITEKNNKTVSGLGGYKIRENGDVKTENEINEKNRMKNEICSENSRETNISSTNGDVPMKKEERTSNKINGKVFETETAKGKADVVQNGSTLNRSKLIPNVSSLYRHHFKNANKSFDENTYEYSAKTPVNEVIGSVPLIPTAELSFSKCPEVQESRIDSSTSEPEEGEKCKESESSEDEKFKKSSFDSFENFEKIIKGEEITLFSAEETRENGTEEEEGEDSGKEEKNDIVPEISRESAGEPDGRADSDDLSEPPALPLKPPPPLNEPRTTFLHDFTAGGDGIKIVSEKPKVPAKPIIIQSKKINFQSPIHSNRPKSPSVENFLMSPQVKPNGHMQQESSSSDSNKNQKRPAPKPPSPKEDSSERYVAVFAEVESDDSGSKTSDLEEPVVKRLSGSTENLLEFITDPEEKNQLTTEGLEEIAVPEPVSRRGLSLSHDSLVPGEIGDNQLKKKPNRGRFFLRKLLHLGKTKETTKDLIVRPKSSLPPFPKTKLEIIHPSDLNGSRVEVVPPARTSKSRRSSSSASSSSGEQKESDVLSDSSTSHSMSSSGNDSQNTMEKTKKPPPPPRSHSFDSWNAKPARPPPPKSIDILRQSNSSWSTSVDTKPDNLYVNLGEARSGLAPNKPLRTGSLRETNTENTKRLVTVINQPEDSDYESFVVTPVQYSTPSHQSDDNLYECVQVTPHRSSLPECDSVLKDSSAVNHTKENKNSNSRNNSHRRSEGNVDLSSDYFKMKFMRSVSLPYCASETESEIYSPYSFYCSEMGDEDYDLSSSSSHALRISRLKLKKGRSIVHKNLEDNYGAVVIANHEALAQVAEQMRQGPTTPPALRSLSTAVNLRWADFTIVKDTVGVVVGRRVFYPALWGTHPVTLSLMAEQGLNSSFHAKGPFNLNALTELNDLVPASYLSMLKKSESELVQASISVLSRLQIESVETYGKSMNVGFLSDESKKEVNFVLLQIINAFKTLQAQGIEEAPKNLTNLIVCREEKDPHPRVCIIHSFERTEEETPISSLCQCVTHAIKDILPPTDLTPLISHVLHKEKADSLSQAKGILEFSLWGPADIAFGNSNRERESSLQRWLDLERATVLHGLVRTRAELTVFEEWQLLFLVRTNAKMMAEASSLLECGAGEEVSTA